MRNEWLEDFRADLISLGKVIWDYQEGVQGSILDAAQELIRVAKQVVREFGDKNWDKATCNVIVGECVLHMTRLDHRFLSNGMKTTIPGTSLLDKIDLRKEDSFSYTVYHMTDYIRKNKQGIHSGYVI